MKILVIAPTPFFSDRGCHIRILGEAQALRKLGHELKIVTYHLGKTPPAIDVVRIRRISWYNKLSAGPSWHKLYLDGLLFFKAWQVNRQFRAQIIHAHLHEGCLIGFLLKKIFGRPLVFDYQGSLSGEIASHNFIKPGGWLFTAFRRLEKIIDAAADKIIISSSAMLPLLRDNFGVAAEKITVAADGIDEASLPGAMTSEDLPDKLGLPRDKTIIGYVGHLSAYQGIDLLLQIAVELVKEFPVHFLIMGYPEEKYAAKSRRLGISAHCTFTGRVPYQELNKYLSLCHLAVSPKLSFYEGNGKLLNYMANKLPVAAFANPVNKEILGEWGIYAAGRTRGDFRQALRLALAKTAAERQEIGERLLARLKNLWLWEKQVLKINTLYSELAKSAVRS